MNVRLTLVSCMSLLLVACGTAPATNAPTTVPVSAPTAAPFASTTAAYPAPAAVPNPTTAAYPAPPQAGNTQCNHPFYPVSATANWQYRSTTTGLAPSTFTLSDSNITANSFTEHRDFTTLQTDNGWSCAADGSLASTQFGNLNTGSTQFQLQTTKNTGVTIPAPKDWQVGTTWNNAYEVKGTMQLSGNTANAQGSIEVTYKIVSQESVTVPAGTYNAFKVTSDTTMKLSVTSGAATVPFNISTAATSWFAPNVGMVKSQSSTQGIDTALELTAFTP